MKTKKTENSIEERNKKLETIRKFAKLLDSQFKIKGFEFGIDPLLSFIPVLGSFSGFITGFILIFMARHKGARGLVLMKMIGNICLDFLVGLIPVIGNFGDFILKSNEKNLKLLEEHFLEDKHNGSGWYIIVSFIALAGVFIYGILYFLNYVIKIFVDFFITLF